MNVVRKTGGDASEFCHLGGHDVWSDVLSVSFYGICHFLPWINSGWMLVAIQVQLLIPEVQLMLWIAVIDLRCLTA